MRERSLMMVLLLFVVLLVGVPRAAHAQETPLSEVLVNLIQAEIVLTTENIFHSAHFVPGRNLTDAPFVFNQAIVSQLSTFPLGSSAGGFTFNFNPDQGTFDRSTNSFGPSFSERAATIGQGRFNLGFRYLHRRYDKFDDEDLEGGNLLFLRRHEDIPGDNFFEGDLVEAALNLRLSTDTFVILANYGVLDDFDVSVAIPIVRVELDARIDSKVLPLATGNLPFDLHSFEGVSNLRSFSDGGTASGIGDVLVRAKYRFLPLQGGGLALGIDLRLPTGDEQELLGTGATQLKVSLIGSNEYAGAFGTHFNIGYTGSGESDSLFFSLADEFAYGFGAEYVPHPRVTILGDILGRTLRNAPTLEEVATRFDFRNSAGVPGSATLQELVVGQENVHLLLGVVGAKVNLGRTLLLSGDILFPLTSAGLTESVTPVLGLEYTF